jgi:hypothetical protein
VKEKGEEGGERGSVDFRTKRKGTWSMTTDGQKLDGVTHLHKVDKVLERRVEMRLLAEVDDTVEMRVVHVRIDAE